MELIREANRDKATKLVGSFGREEGLLSGRYSEVD
jgi:hypothetical protein